ncbi:hypothetical protein ACOSP7_023665 [Xanthoceras sorbifolium]
MPSTRALLATNHSLAGRSGSAFQVRYPNRLLCSTGSLAPSSILSVALLLGSSEDSSHLAQHVYSQRRLHLVSKGKTTPEDLPSAYFAKRWAELVTRPRFPLDNHRSLAAPCPMNQGRQQRAGIPLPKKQTYLFMYLIPDCMTSSSIPNVLLERKSNLFRLGSVNRGNDFFLSLEIPSFTRLDQSNHSNFPHDSESTELE